MMRTSATLVSYDADKLNEYDTAVCMPIGYKPKRRRAISQSSPPGWQARHTSGLTV
jgi:hypothetical protein